MTYEIREGSWRIAIRPTAIEAFLTAQIGGNTRVDIHDEEWVTVEALLAISGMRPHGLLIVSFSSGGESLETTLNDTGQFDLQVSPEHGLLGRGLHPGLPAELGQAAVGGARAATLASPMRTGRLTFAGGGLDYDSAEFVFEKLGELAVVALSARMRGIDEPSAIHAAVAAW